MRGWLSRPSGLAFAGGLCAVIFAVAFGTKMYQASLEQAAGPGATENAPPDTVSHTSSPPQPSSVEPPLKSKASVDSVRTPAKKDALDDRSVERKSARAMFNGIESGSNAAVGSASQATRPDDQAKRLTAAGKATEVASSKPLGLRYSFVARDTDGRERVVDAVTAAKSAGPVRISLESNQDAYLQILQTLGTAGTRLWWPPQETGKISLKVIAGKRNEIPLPPPAESGLLSLIVRLSPKPFAPLTMQEVGMLDRFAANLLIESVAADEIGAQEQATYVVSQDSSQTAQMTVEVPIRR